MASDHIPSSFQKKINSVLNSIEPLLREASSESLPLEVGAIVIYSPAILISKHYFYKCLGFESSPYLSKAGSDDFEYEFSNIHFELSVNQTAIGFMKDTSRNQSITMKRFIYFIDNLTELNKPLQGAMKRLIDSYIRNCTFVFAVESLSGIDRGILDRSCIINLNKRLRALGLGDICLEQLAIDRAIMAFLYSVKTLKPYELISRAKDLAYRLFHVACPLSRVCKIIADYFVDDEALYVNVVNTMAELERNSQQLHKYILVYEQVILLAAQKFAKLMNPQAKRKAGLKTTTKKLSTPVSQQTQEQEQEPLPEPEKPKKSIKPKPKQQPEPEPTITQPVKKSIRLKKKTDGPTT